MKLTLAIKLDKIDFLLKKLIGIKNSTTKILLTFRICAFFIRTKIYWGIQVQYTMLMHQSIDVSPIRKYL